jgi:hypothetical protein
MSLIADEAPGRRHDLTDEDLERFVQSCPIEAG